MPGKPRRATVGPIGDGRDQMPTRVNGNDLTRAAAMQGPIQPTSRDTARRVVGAICDYTDDETVQRELAAMLLAPSHRRQSGPTSPIEWGVA